MASVSLKRDGAIAELTIERADKLNALDRDTLLELRAAIGELQRDPAHVVLLASAGDRVFVSGADIAAMSAMSVEEASAVGQFLTRSASVALSARIFTKPSPWNTALARALPMKGNLPTL